MRVYPENIEAHETHMTPTAKRNSYRVVGMHTIHYGLTEHGLSAKLNPYLSEGKEARANSLKHSRNKLKPLEEVWVGAAALGRGIWIDTKKGQTVSHY